MLRLDDPLHLAAALVATLARWEALCSVVPPAWHFRLITIVHASLAAFGLGALKKLSDDIGGMNDDPAGVAWSTRWDLVFNTAGATVAAASLWARGRFCRTGETTR